MIIDIVQECQRGNQEATLELIKKFEPALRKYARKIGTEDAYYDLQLDLLETINTIKCNELKQRGDGALVNYISHSIRHACGKRIREIIAQKTASDSIDETPDAAFYRNSAYHEPKFPCLDIPEDLLTSLEKKTLFLIHAMGYSAAEVARARGVTRQNVNQVKLRAEEKLRKYLTETGQA